MDTSKNTFTVKDDKGNIKKYEIIFTFDSNETKKSYVVYTDNTKENGKLKVYANIYDKIGASKELKPIEKEEEWNTIEAFLSKLKEDKNENK